MKVALVDTSSYLRLARCLRPFLGRPFGPPPWVGRALAELEREYESKPSLADSHYWFSEPAYVTNREAHKLNTLTMDLARVRSYHQAILGYCKSNAARFRKADCTPPSPADCLIAAYAATLNDVDGKAAVVTDDKGLHLAITELETSDVLHGYEVLAHFVDDGHITIDAAKALYSELHYQKALPNSWARGCSEAFGFVYSSP